MSLFPGPGIVDVKHPVRGLICLWPVGGEQRAIDAVLGHELGGLGGKRLRFIGCDRFILGLRQQLAHTVEQPLRRFS